MLFAIDHFTLLVDFGCPHFNLLFDPAEGVHVGNLYGDAVPVVVVSVIPDDQFGFANRLRPNRGGTNDRGNFSVSHLPSVNA